MGYDSLLKLFVAEMTPISITFILPFLELVEGFRLPLDTTTSSSATDRKCDRSRRTANDARRRDEASHFVTVLSVFTPMSTPHELTRCLK